MKIAKIALIVIVFALTASALLLVLTGNSQQNGKTGKLKVVTSIFPLTDITKNIAGDKVEIVQLLPAGASEHTFELNIEQRRELEGADLGIIVGAGLDDKWAGPLFKEQGSEVLDLSGAVELRRNDEDEIEAYGEFDPHYWLTVQNAKIIATVITDKLAELDKTNTDLYRSNLADYLAQLDILQGDINRTLNNISTRKLITFHEAFAYFAEEFNLEVVATIEPFPGKEPTSQYLAEVVRIVQGNNVGALFKEPQLSDSVVKSLAEDYGITVYTLDPVGGIDQRTSYVELMRYNAATIAQALK